MTEDQLEQQARQVLDRALKDAPAGREVLHVDEQTGYYSDVRRRISDHKFVVLANSDDMVVFFNRQGKFIGWRDDGRKGTSVEAPVDREALFRAIRDELELPKTAVLSRAQPRLLPPVGWTQEAIVFLEPAPAPDQVLHVWVNPLTLRVIQCLYGREGLEAPL
ncbi:MAG: hypothetical protein Q8N47_24170 [Bryobacterales bacterium]|nr:hypothetical protein [Bryobacterales bacterium]